MLKTCFSCGQSFQHNYGSLMITLNEPSKLQLANVDGFCSQECQEKDNQRLVEGNGIIAAAQAQTENTALSDINKLRLDVSGPIGQTLGTMLHFGRPKVIEPIGE